MLLELIESEELHRFKQKFITPLLENDKKNQGNYIETLRVYFNNGKNAKVTAEKLFTHYNTVLYRLDRITSLLKIDLNHSDSSFQLQLALKIYELEKIKSDSVSDV